MVSYPIVVLKLNAHQRKVLKKTAVLEIDTPPEEIKEYISDILKKSKENPITVLAYLLHASKRTLTSFTEFKYTDDDGESKTDSIMTHIFEIEYPLPEDEIIVSEIMDPFVSTE